MTKEDVSITYENNIFYCTKNNIKWISIDGEKWYVEEKRIAELEAQIEKMKCCGNCKHCKYSESEESYEWCEKHDQVVNIAIKPCYAYEMFDLDKAIKEIEK